MQQAIFGLVTKGQRIQVKGDATADFQQAQQTDELITAMINAYWDAHLSLSLFSQTHTETWARVRFENSQKFMRERHERDLRKYEIERELSTGRESLEEESKIKERAELLHRQERWAAGEMPFDFQVRMPSLYAHSFLTAVDMIGKLLLALKQEPGASPDIEAAEERFACEFKNVRLIRNSALHLEDRIRNIGARKKNPSPLVAKPVQGYGIHNPNNIGDVRILGALYGNQLVYLLDNGETAHIEVSEKTLAGLQPILQLALDAFNWQGPPKHHPA